MSKVEVSVSWNQNHTLLLKFTPSEDTWKFPKGKKLRLFNLIHNEVSKFESPTAIHYDIDDLENPSDYPQKSLDEITTSINSILLEWVEKGELVVD